MPTGWKGKVQELPEIRFRVPESYVVSVRLNREESRALTEAARFHGMKLSTYIKQQAMQAAGRAQIRYTGNC